MLILNPIIIWESGEVAKYTFYWHADVFFSRDTHRSGAPTHGCYLTYSAIQTWMVERIDGCDNQYIMVLKTLRLGTNGQGRPVLTSHSNFAPHMKTYCHFRLVISVLYVSVSGYCCCSRACVW